MARTSLAKPPQKLNHSRRHIALIQDILIAGGLMADALRALPPEQLSKNAAKAKNRWGDLMVLLAKSLL